MGVMRTVLLKASESTTLATRLPNYPFARKAVRRFMPGENVADALRECARLQADQIGTVITRLGENITDLTEAGAVSEHYVAVLEDIKARSLNTQISVKLTQLGLDIDRELCERHLMRLAQRASEVGNFVWVDMEYSSYVDRTIAAFNHVRERYTNIGLCLQAYLHRTPQDLEQLLRGFNAAYNGRRQRVLDGRTPDQVVAERLKKRRKLANPMPQGRAGPDDISKARLIAEAAKEVSQPDS